MNNTFYIFMKLLPKCTVSRAFGFFTRLKIPFISKKARDIFAKAYRLNMEESEYPLSHYRNIAELFIRHLKPGARPIANANVVSPVDGHLSQTGILNEEGVMIQAKGKTYTLASLLRNNALAKKFIGGSFATIYLAPFNYHRIHAPISGNLIGSYYCPGTLWPVNLGSVERIEGLFCINERLITHIQGNAGEEMLVVKVGATNVGRIAVEYDKNLIVNANKLKRNKPRFSYPVNTEYHFEKGSELGRFEMGSTVILVANKTLSDKNPGLFTNALDKDVLMGEALSI